MHTCSHCGVTACFKASDKPLPKNCPMHNKGIVEASRTEYEKAGLKQFHRTSSEVEGVGYGRWPRIKEIGEFCRKMGYKKIGMAFCLGLKSEAMTVANILKQYDLEVVSVICKFGGIPKSEMGIPQFYFVNPDDANENMCNPIGQAMTLNEQKTEFNITVGLCVGHDSMFYKYSDALATSLVTKDRLMAHNPIGAIYCQFYNQKKVAPDEKSPWFNG